MMAIPFSLASSTPSSGGRANGQLIIPPTVNRDRQNSPSNSNLAAINAAGATMRMRNGRSSGTLRCTGLHHPDEPDDEPVLTAMAALFESLHEVHLEGGSDPWKPSIKTADGFRACKQFLYALSAAADALKIRPQSREYRNQFTKNYRALFPDQKRHYRVDVLEASQEGYTMIYVNGERFDFHGSVVESGVNFKLAWITAMDKLQQLQRQNLSTYLYWRSELVPILVDLDSKWADFEQEYILELIQIERKARRYVMDVIYLENQLIYLDGSVATLVAKGDASETAHLHIWQQWQSCRRDYVRKIFRLNAIANYRRRGRGDLNLSVLETAENIIKTSESHPGHVYEAVSSIAASCVTSFNDFRKHINELAQTPERIDPHLCNNVTLVNHLVRLEETWELAQKYLMDTQRLQNIIHIVDFILSVVRTQKAIIAILSSADAAAAAPAGDSSSSSSNSSSSSSSSNCTSSVNFDKKMRSTTVTGAATTTVAATHLECEKKRSLEDIFSSSSSSASSSFSTFSSNPAFSGCCCSSSSTTTTTSTTNNCRDTGSERPPHQRHQHEEEEEEEEDCEELTATSDSGMLQSGAFISQKKENATDAAGMKAAAAAATGSSTSRSDTLSCTTRGSIMRQRTSSSTSADRRETLEEKLIACDVEAFLALPRFVCLYYLLDPIRRFHILRQFLPHYFVDCQGLSDSCVETVEEVYSKNSQQQQQQHMSLFAPLRKGSGAATASSTEEGGGGEAAAKAAAAASTAAAAAASTATAAASTAAAANTAAAAAAGCTSSSTGSSGRSHCTRSVEQLQKTGALPAAATTLGGGGESASAAASASSATVRGGGSSRRGANAGFRCPDFFTEDADEQEAGMDVQQQQIQQEGEVVEEEEDDDEGKEKEEEDCRLLSIAASDATTRPPSRLSSNFDTAVSLAGTTVSPAASQLSISSCSLPAAASTAAAVVSAAAAACENGQHLCDMGCCRQNACSSRSKLLTSQEEAESEGSTECSSSLRESTDSGISSSSSSSSLASAGSAAAASFDFSSSSSSSTYANVLTNTAIAATPAIATSSTEAAAFAPSSGAIAAAASSSSSSSCTTGQQQQQQKGLRGYVCSGSKEDRYYHCNSSSSSSAAATATAANERMCSNEWFVQQQQHSSRIILSKVPAGLKKMVKAWMRIQSWLKAEGLQDSKEAWLCIIARLSDSEDFKLLLQKWAETKLAGFRHHLEALFQSVEEISMALQRSSPQDWNEFLQAIIQGIQSDSPSRRSLL